MVEKLNKNTNRENINSIGTPNYERATSSIYNLIHSSNKNDATVNNTNNKDNTAGTDPNNVNNENTKNHNSSRLTNQPNGKNLNIIPQEQNLNINHMTRVMLPSLSNQSSNLASGIGLPQQPSTLSSNDSAFQNPNIQQVHDSFHYHHQNNLNRSVSNLTNFQSPSFASDSTSATRMYSLSNQVSSNDYQRSYSNGEENIGGFQSSHIQLAQHQNSMTGLSQYNYIHPSSQSTTPPAPSQVVSTDVNTNYAFKPIIKTKVNKNLLSSRRNTQEMVAKSIAEKRLDNPISEYASVVKEAEIELLNADPLVNSKSAIQALEQKKERERQVYALLWLMKNCEAQHDSYVPRGRIFAQYASSCAQYNLKPLSQASLGKLIRTVFPGLTTRRLGMRGQSKYHYCGLRLINTYGNDDEGENDDTDKATDSIEYDISSGANTPVKETVVETSEEIKENTPEVEINEGKRKADNSDDNTNRREVLTKKIKLQKEKTESDLVTEAMTKDDSISLRNILPNIFQNEEILSKNLKLNLPPIPRSNLSGNIDEDLVSSLESLYHIYCNKNFENIKFLKFDFFSDDSLSFYRGSISPQMYTHLISEELQDWVTECDRITHISVVKFLSNFIIGNGNSQQPEADHITKLEALIESYPNQISKLTSRFPLQLRTSKNQLAKEFTGLIKKLLKLQHFVEKFLNSFESFKDGMEEDWNAIKLDDIYGMVSTEKYHEICRSIKIFLSENMPILFEKSSKDEKSSPRDAFSKLLFNFLSFFSEQTTWSANTIINSYTRFTNALLGDISLKSPDNLLLWLFFNNVTVQLLNYSYEATKFVTM